MTTTAGSPATADPRAMLEDWLTIWQSELAGLVVDREAQAAVVRAGADWAALMRAGALPVPGAGRERAGGPAGADEAAGPSAVAAASDAGPGGGGRDAVIERLLARVAELDRRVGGGAPG